MMLQRFTQGPKSNSEGTLHEAGLARSLALSLFLVLAAPLANADIKAGDAKCLECHGEKGQVLKFKDGGSKAISIDKDGWLDSIHGRQLTCTDCHREITGYPHPKNNLESARKYTIDRSNTCQRCHYAYYTRVLDSIHYEMLQAGETSAPTCVDCHGSHYIKDPKNPPTEVNKKCGRCHESVSQVFAKSVHGKALLEEGNRDVPVCTDCHGAHAIKDPKSVEARVHSHEACIKCHGDQQRMKKYDLNPDVVSTYLEDFHGASNRLYAQGGGGTDKPLKQIATCVDCHGIHDIESFRQLSKDKGKEAVKNRVIVSCRKCHEQVPAGFADAWLSHYPATLESAPLVWIVKMVYRVLIPLILAGLVLHILLHLWRLRTHR